MADSIGTKQSMFSESSLILSEMKQTKNVKESFNFTWLVTLMSVV